MRKLQVLWLSVSCYFLLPCPPRFLPVSRFLTFCLLADVDEGFDSDDEVDLKPKPVKKVATSAAARRKSAAGDAEFKLKSGTIATGARRSTRNSNASHTGAGTGEDDGDEEDRDVAMDVEL